MYIASYTDFIHCFIHGFAWALQAEFEESLHISPPMPKHCATSSRPPSLERQGLASWKVLAAPSIGNSSAPSLPTAQHHHCRIYFSLNGNGPHLFALHALGEFVSLMTLWKAPKDLLKALKQEKVRTLWNEEITDTISETLHTCFTLPAPHMLHTPLLHTPHSFVHRSWQCSMAAYNARTRGKGDKRPMALMPEIVWRQDFDRDDTTRH